MSIPPQPLQSQPLQPALPPQPRPPASNGLKIALIIGGVLFLAMALLAMLAIAFSVVFPTKFNEFTSGFNPDPTPTPEVVIEGNNRIILSVHSPDPGAIDTRVLEAVSLSTAGRLDRAGLTPAEVATTSENSLTITFPDEMPRREVLQAEQLLTQPSTPGFYEFVYEFSAEALNEDEIAGSGLAPEEIDVFQMACSELLTESIEAFSGEVLCPISQASKFAVGELLLEASAISEVEKFDEETLLLGLTKDGALVLTDLSEQVAQLATTGQNRIALVVNREVVVAPTITQRVPGTALQLHISDGTIDEVHAVFLLLSKSVMIEVSTVYTD